MVASKLGPAVATLLLLINLDWCRGFPFGAPPAACSSLSPNPFAHEAQPQTSQVPYEIDLSAFDDGTGSLSYTPGETVSSMCTMACNDLLIIAIA